MRTSRLGVVVPLANESATVDAFLSRVLAQLGPADLVYCVLDLASRDDTLARVQATARGDPRVSLVWAPEDRSVGDAYRRGYRAALEDEVEWIVEMDGGLSHRPEELPRFLDSLDAGAEFVAGSRFTHGGSYAGSAARRLLSRGGTLLVNLVLGTSMTDMTSGYEAFTRPCLTQLMATGTRSQGHFLQTEIRVFMHRRRWVEVPITYCSPSGRVGVEELIEAVRTLARLYRGRQRPAAGWSKP